MIDNYFIRTLNSGETPEVGLDVVMLCGCCFKGTIVEIVDEFSFRYVPHNGHPAEGMVVLNANYKKLTY